MHHILLFENILGASAEGLRKYLGTKALPWLVHQGPQGKTVFFAGWILSPGAASSGRYMTGLRGGLHPAAESEWKEWTHSLFGKGMAADILLSMANRYGIKPLSLWIMLPYPYQPQGEARLKAVAEWAGAVRHLWLKRFGLSGHRLEGFVWGRESIPDGDLPLVRSFNQWVRKYGLGSLWLANYGSAHVNEWKGLGFTHSALFSNYTGKGPYPRQWLDASMSYASVHRMGLQCVYGDGLRFAENSHQDYLHAAAAYAQAGGEGPIVHRFVFPPRHAGVRPSSPLYEAIYRTVRGGR